MSEESYTYKVWHDSGRSTTHCFFSIRKGDRVIKGAEYIIPSFLLLIFSSNVRVIENSLKRGKRLAEDTIDILLANEIGV